MMNEEMNVEEAQRYIEDHFDVTGLSAQLVRNILEHFKNNKCATRYADELNLKDMLDGLGIEDIEAHYIIEGLPLDEINLDSDYTIEF